MPFLKTMAGRPVQRRFVIPAYRSVPYRKATLHPWSCLLFLLPLLAAYEVGVVWVGGTEADALRNGVDAWLRWALESFGLNQLYFVPALVALIFVVWSALRYEDRPNDLPGVWLGMAIESVVFGLGLWGLSRAMGPLVDALTVELSPAAAPGEGVAQVVTYVGAGIYEELVFRLVLYSGLVVVLRALKTPVLLAVPLSAMVSATLFAGAHHIGPYGEAFDDYVFLFRVLAGLYFAALYQFRGFGIAVGAHACFDVLVG
jgi:hypothetical protein